MRPEHASHHRAPAQRLAGRGIEQVDAGCDHAVDRVRELDLVETRSHRPAAVLAGDRLAVDQHLQDLLDVERVPLRARDDPARELARKAAHPDERLDQLQRLRLGKGREPDRGGIPHASSPCAARVEELGSRGADRQDGGVGERVGQLVEQLEQRLRRPVHVLDHQHGQLLAAEPAEVSPPALAEERADVALVVRRQRKADRPADRVDDPGDVLRPDVPRNDRLELQQRSIGGVAVEDPRVALRGLAERPVRDALAVREASTQEEVRAGQLRHELREEAGLPDPGVPVDRHELRCPLPGDPGRERAEDDQLLLPADHVGGEALDAARAGQRDDRDRLPRRKRGCLSLRLSRSQVPVTDRASRRRLRPLTDQHLTRYGTLLKARRDVDGIAADHQLAARRSLSSGDNLARVHADAQSDLGSVARSDVRGERSELVAHGKSRPHRALGVVVVRERDTEDGQHGVADELLAEPSEPLDLGVDELEQIALDHPELLGVDPGTERGRAGEVCEEDGHDPPLLVLFDHRAARAALPERRAAGGAEGGVRRRFGAAGRADPRERCAADAAEAVARGLVGTAGRAGHGRCHGSSTVPSARTSMPSWSRRSRTRYWNADQAPGWTSTIR